MKKAVFAASVAAASSAALAAAALDHRSTISTSLPSSSSVEGLGSSRKKETAGSGSRRGGEDKFAPRFDGLRFIETLVTAHR